MAYVKDTGLLAGPFVGLAYAQIVILNRHVEAAERDHLGPMLNMEVIEIGLAKDTIGDQFFGGVAPSTCGSLTYESGRSRT